MAPGGDNCFAVVASNVPAGQNSNFTIYIDDASGAAIKSCTNDANQVRLCPKLSDGTKTWC